jgi:16S rRNA (cytidine1402-2'-O)-methyltransferase
VAAGTLYIVATPIGNLEDITLRALRVLKEADLIAAEDTRHTRGLLERYGVATPFTSYHEHNEAEKGPYLLKRLMGGDSVALVSDAGTPGVSDPGFRLLRLALGEGLPVVAVPGPSALTAALSVSGLPLDRFTFLGFVPHAAAAKRRFLGEMTGREETFVMFESARRLKGTLACILEEAGDAGAVMAREMTKVHEEVLRGTVRSLMEAVGDRELKGEVTLVIRPTKAERGAFPVHELEAMLKRGLSLSEAVKAVAGATGLPRNEVYREALRISGRIKGALDQGD